jgi:hypothetical protein
MSGQKQFNLIITTANDQKIGVEIELSAKWERDLDVFVFGCIQSIKNKKVDKILIISDSKAILKRYKAALEPDATYKKWSKQNNTWVVESEYAVGVEVENKILFELVTMNDSDTWLTQI